MAYRITLTRAEAVTLDWLADHGYDGDLTAQADAEESDDGTTIVLRLTEPSAWIVRDNVEEDRHAWLACCGDDGLAAKLESFLASIV